MSSVTSELEQALHQLDAKSASLLEQLVRDALALVGRKSEAPAPLNANAWPPRYFERTAGSFANEPLEAPDDPPPNATPDW